MTSVTVFPSKFYIRSIISNIRELLFGRVGKLVFGPDILFSTSVRLGAGLGGARL